MKDIKEVAKEDKVTEDKNGATSLSVEVVEVDPLEVLMDVSGRKNITDEITLFRKKDNKVIKFKVGLKPIEGTKYKEIQQQCTTEKMGRRGAVTTTVDTRRVQRFVVLECVTKPDLKDPKILAAWGINEAVAEDVVEKCFLPGEVDRISDRALTLSGYTDDAAELVKG